MLGFERVSGTRDDDDETTRGGGVESCWRRMGAYGGLSSCLRS